MKKFKLALVALLCAGFVACESSDEEPNTTSPYQYTYTQDLVGANDYDYTYANQTIGLDFLEDGDLKITFEEIKFMETMPYPVTFSVTIPSDDVEENIFTSVGYSFSIADTLSIEMDGAASDYATFSNLEFVFTSNDIVSSFDVTTPMVKDSLGNATTFSFEYASTVSIAKDATYSFYGTFSNNNASFPYSQFADVIAIPSSDYTSVDICIKQFKFISFMPDYINMVIPNVPCTYDATGTFTATITDAITPISDEDLTAYGDVTSLSFTFSYGYGSMTGTFTLNNENKYDFTNAVN